MRCVAVVLVAWRLVRNAQLSSMVRRYYMLEEGGEIPRFHYGSHYSNAGMVLLYLMRVEPFTTLHIDLQEGRFDQPDRLFFDLLGSFRSCLTAMSDVKELTPEFFCLPDFLINKENLDLGERQNNLGRVNDVQLPPWAKTPREFIRLHRKALESEYVSLNLHHWIDLIFGYKQRGEAAVEANNVFYYLTYEGMTNLDDIEDQEQRDATKLQISSFGQTPTQLFRAKHPQRLPVKECCLSLLHDGLGQPSSRHGRAMSTMSNATSVASSGTEREDPTISVRGVECCCLPRLSAVKRPSPVRLRMYVVASTRATVLGCPSLWCCQELTAGLGAVR